MQDKAEDTGRFQAFLKDEQICVIHNPAAGTRRDIDLAGLASSAGRRFPIWRTEGPGEAEKMAARAAEQGYRIVVAAGGDGTVNEVARGLLGSGSALAIIPLGSGNGLARHLGIPQDPVLALGGIGGGGFSRMDVGRINGRSFLCAAGIGFDAHVSRHFANAARRGFGAYLRTVLTRYAGYRPTQLTASIDGLEIASSCYLMAFANASQYGNDTFIAPHADISDGALDICLIDRLPLWRAARVGWALMAGSMKRWEAGTFHTATAISVRCREALEFHVDGDYAGTSDHFEVSLSPLALEVALSRRPG